VASEPALQDVHGQEDAAPAEPELSEGRLRALVESLLFVAAEPAAIPHLAQTLGVPVPAVERALSDLAEAYREGGPRGIRLQRVSDRVQLVSMPEAAPYVERYLGLDASPRLSTAAAETLAVVAYNQPVTRAEIEAVRGVSCDAVLRTLIGRGLVEPNGRLEQAGRPILYGTSFQFLQYFGLEDLKGLPPLPSGDQHGLTAANL
jgi:segregation and condensation protein B